MFDPKANRAIGCTVHECAYHCGKENYCTLESIKVGTHETNPQQCECTDCESSATRLSRKEKAIRTDGFFLWSFLICTFR
ncbi:MAG: DUF1540 domain-containing protein [Oscillospiraceae bacterium]|nr:DUF1540 domain-containing protein [Oscillospiraceae bacterium]